MRTRIMTGSLAVSACVALLPLVMPTATPRAPGWVSSAGMASLEQGASLNWSATVTEEFARLQDPRQLVRFVDLDADVVLGNIQVQDMSQIRGVLVTGADPVRIDTVELDLGAALDHAAYTLGVDTESLGEAVLPAYRVILTRVEGLTWAEVAQPTHLVLTVEPAS